MRATLLANQQDNGGRIVIAGDDVYWTNPQSGVVRKASVFGGGIDTVAVGQTHAVFIAADADSVYWATDAAVMRATPR